MYPQREPRTLTEEEISVIRGLNLEPFSQVDPWGCVWVVKDKDGEMYMAKSILKVSYEMLALQKLRSLPSPRNITIPGRLYECSDTYIFLMPFLSRLEDLIKAPNVSWMRLLSYFDAMIDYVEFLHANNIAYFDVSDKNIVWAATNFRRGGFDIPADGIFYIDVGSTRLLPSGPGSGIRIHDFRFYGGAFMPPEGLDAVEPYAYDVFAMTQMFGYLTSYFERINPNVYTPRCWEEWLDTMEDPIPEKRPSIVQFHRQFSALKTWMARTAWMYRVFRPAFADALGSFGWKIVSLFVC